MKREEKSKIVEKNYAAIVDWLDHRNAAPLWLRGEYLPRIQSQTLPIVEKTEWTLKLKRREFILPDKSGHNWWEFAIATDDETNEPLVMGRAKLVPIRNRLRQLADHP